MVPAEGGHSRELAARVGDDGLEHVALLRQVRRILGLGARPVEAEENAGAGCDDGKRRRLGGHDLDEAARHAVRVGDAAAHAFLQAFPMPLGDVGEIAEERLPGELEPTWKTDEIADVLLPQACELH